MTEAEWTPPDYWTPEEVEYWKGLDHFMCTHYGFLDISMERGYATCHSMHCPECGKSTSSQGHMKKVGDEWICPTPEDQRKPWPKSKPVFRLTCAACGRVGTKGFGVREDDANGLRRYYHCLSGPACDRRRKARGLKPLSEL